MRERGVRHRDVDVVAAARTLNADERRQDSNRCARGTAEQIGDLQVAKRGRAVAHAGLIEHAGVTKIIDVVTGHLGTRSGLAIARNRCVDDARIDFCDRGVVDREARHDAGPKTLDDHVSFFREREKNVAPTGILEVDCSAALVAVYGAVERRNGAGTVAEIARVIPRAGVLDLDDVGAEIGQIKRADRTRKESREVEDAQVRERACVAASAHESPRACEPVWQSGRFAALTREQFALRGGVSALIAV